MYRIYRAATEVIRFVRIKLGFPKVYYGVVPIYGEPGRTFQTLYPAIQGQKFTAYMGNGEYETFEVA